MPRGFADALRAVDTTTDIGVIAEVKKASPSKGIICQDFNLRQQHKPMKRLVQPVYPYSQTVIIFKVMMTILLKPARLFALPVLRKDFMVDEYQIIESAAMGRRIVFYLSWLV